MCGLTLAVPLDVLADQLFPFVRRSGGFPDYLLAPVLPGLNRSDWGISNSSRTYGALLRRLGGRNRAGTGLGRRAYLLHYLFRLSSSEQEKPVTNRVKTGGKQQNCFSFAPGRVEPRGGR